jgi:hypothetical protein
MGSAIAEVVPAAVAVALINPLPIMAVILMLFSPRATSTAPAFVVGWVLSLVVVLSLLLFVASPEGVVGSEHEPSILSSIVRIVLGVALLFLAFRKWGSRPQPGEEKALPSWMEKLEGATPTVALGFGALFSGANPKNFAFMIAAVLAIAQAELTAGQQVIPVAIFVLLASIGVGAPVLWYFIARDSAVQTLARGRVWLTANYATMMTIVFLLFGTVLLAKGLGGLIG